MKIIFLDFDGVLVNRETLKSGFPGFGHPDCVAALNHIGQRTQARIVVSSTWRMEGIDACRDHLSRWGVVIPVLDATPRTFTSRGHEIDMWLKDNRDVEDFVILDDDSDMEPHISRLIKTNFDTGLTWADAAKAIHILTQPR